MTEYPDPDEEFELMYGDDFDCLQDHDEPRNISSNIDSNGKSRRSLDFSSPAIRKTFGDPVTDKSIQQIPPSSENQHESLTDGVVDACAGTSKISAFNESGIDKLCDLTQASQTPKRSLEDLFGDIDDLNFDDIELFHKEKKLKGDKDQQDEALMNKIINMRKQKQQLGIPSALLNRDYTESNSVRGSRISVGIPRWPFLPVTRSDGNRLYVGFKSEETMETEIDELTQCQRGFKNLLGSAFRGVWDEAKQYLDSKAVTLVTREQIVLSGSDIVENEDLWVERYRPRTYLELLSDESTNRTLLYWLKMWDKVVFNREVKVKQPEVKSSFNKRSGKFEFGGGKKREADAEWETPLDEHGRPRKLLALLCGPPGSGKTTLAHLLARHAGYKVVEVNASDDRNVETFKSALENATQMTSVLDSEKRPNCLILDEIDGAPLPAIEYLIKFVCGTAAKPKKGQKSKVHILKRPILCICNDPYAPALRPLRQVAIVLHLPPPGAGRLSERLAEVSTQEGFPLDPPLLAALGERTNRDIRACLTILHFCKLKGKQLKLADIQLDKLNIGMKDANKSLFQVWQEVFQLQGEENGRPRRLLTTVYSAGGGDYDRLVSGVYENFLNMKMRDSRLTGVCLALDWFAMHDQFSSFINSSQNYSLMGYLPYSFLCWHFLFASMSWPSIKFPTQGYQMFQKQSQLTGITSGVQRGVCAQVKPFCSRQSLLLDLMPALPHIISPALRPVNVQLYTERERRSLASLIGVMLDYNLQYTQQRLPDGNYHYLLDPDITAVGVFDEKTANVRNLTYNMKQLIAREVELERIRKAEASTKSSNSNLNMKNKAVTDNVNSESTESVLPNHMQRLQPKTMKLDAPLVMKDFFGRTITCSPATAAKKAGRIGDIVKSPTWYHYKEGFNNAVRRDVKISDLL